jgi:hypothetical protein
MWNVKFKSCIDKNKTKIFGPQLKVLGQGDIIGVRGVTGGGAGGAIAPPHFIRIEGAAGNGGVPPWLPHYYLPPQF